ncbi:hypothetical protein C0989_007099 [Termitomyces sp. Mn162]|nr:hypothetical protein C0989_007099 [Termitomyces sp. Mn162]
MHPTRELNLENIREDALHVEGESQLVEEGKTSNQAKITYPPESENNPRTLATSARRPLTRSQTGIVTKRHRPDETPLPEVIQKSTPALKRIKSASNKAVESSNMTTTKADTVVVPPPPRQISPSKDGHIHEPSITDTPITHPSSKLRANLPIPVPNLTKKSRGRRVPTKLGNDAGTPANPKDATRIYVCKVENCGKCFHRGEHLKRHIRSIHTHEKPFKCTYPSCNKHFNRHDNLLQHLKVHRDLATSETSVADDVGSPIELRRNSPSPLFVEQSPSQLQPYYPPHDSYEASAKQARMPTTYHQPPVHSFRSYAASFASISEPVSLRTNIAVSSLRTEIPQSPPKSP